MMCSWARNFTSTVPLKPEIQIKLLGQLDKVLMLRGGAILPVFFIPRKPYYYITYVGEKVPMASVHQWLVCSFPNTAVWVGARGHRVLFLAKALYFHSASLH